MAVKLTKKLLCIIFLVLSVVAIGFSVQRFVSTFTQPNTIATLDHLATVFLSKGRARVYNKPKRSVDVTEKECSSAKEKTVKAQVGIFTDLCEVMTGRNDGCFYQHPETVHYVKFTKSFLAELTFQEFISIVSAHRFYKPQKIIIHSNARHFVGKYWQLSKGLGTKVELEYEDRITAIGKDEQRPHWITHEADILKVKKLIQQGGIFMDFDAVILNGTKLRANQKRGECVFGADSVPCTRLCAGFISCTPNSTFVRAWWQGYQEDYVPYLWVYNAGTVPSNILRSCTNCYDVYVDRTISDMNSAHRWMKKNGLDWKSKSVAHYMNHMFGVRGSDITPDALYADLAGTSLGDMFLYILGDDLSKVFSM